MKSYSLPQPPIELCGLAPGASKGRYWKLPEAMDGRISDAVSKLGRRSTGGRVRFRTDSARIDVRVSLLTLSPDQNFPILGSAGCDILSGLGDDAFLRGIASPLNYVTKIGECSFEKPREMEDITIYLPRNELVEDLCIFLEDGARIEAPTPYRWPAPIVFYGSSITEGCSASRPSNAYTALVARWLHADFRNLGFSGAAKGEPAMAAYIARLDMAAFVMDYDHNAPDPDHLRATHEPFFQRIRDAHPNLPILLLSSPSPEYNAAEMALRRNIVETTYRNARAQGDQNVAFVDGRSLFGARGRSACTIDALHPNDLGMMRMAEAVYPALDALLMRRPARAHTR